jgi:ferritin
MRIIIGCLSRQGRIKVVDVQRFPPAYLGFGTNLQMKEGLMINERIRKEFNEQINAELYSSYLYLSISAYFQSMNLPGFANWMRCQSQEELVHVMKFYTFIHDRGGKVILSTIESPPTEWESPLAAFEETYRHEQKVTGLINNLVDVALQEKDHAANAFLQWFVTEQVEEESSTDGVVQQLKIAGDQGSGIFLIDRELAARIFVMPATLGPA